MNFVQYEFLIFLSVMLVLYWSLRNRRAQNLLLVGGSCIFYGWVHPWFLILLFASSVLDYFVAQAIVSRPRYKAYLLMLSMVGNLGILGFFKYFNFFIENFVGAAELLGVTTNLRTLDILLPVGVSFYTFQTMSYSIDVYRGELRPRRDFLDYVLFVTFFPQLVAGPIERASRLLPQAERDRVFSLPNLVSGLSLALWGAFKKMVIADTVAPFVDKIFILANPSGPEIWAGALGFTIQIFADFSGYTDMARGTARMLGFELTENFRSPFLAATTPEFWQRWHISLSQWIRDYVMVPLLGSSGRLTTFRFIWATILTFVIIGFWHGASWNFILFGAFHGVWMTIYTLVGRVLPESVRNMPFGRPLAVAFHLLAVSLPGSLLFRETHIERLIRHFSTNPFVAEPDQWIAAITVAGVTMVLAIPLILSHFVEHYWWDRLEKSVWWWPLQTTTWSVIIVFLILFYRVTSYDFIYFQF